MVEVKAPWSWCQVVALNTYQNLGTVHPFTCGVDACRASLVAHPEGWRCPRPECAYVQGYALEFMADPEWIGRRQIVEMEMYWRDPDGGYRKKGEDV